MIYTDDMVKEKVPLHSYTVLAYYSDFPWRSFKPSGVYSWKDCFFLCFIMIYSCMYI